MSVERLNALIMFERAQPATPIVLASDYDALVTQNLKIRDKLLELAKECARCDGTGLVTRHFPGNEGVPEWDADDQPCPECEDIRAVLA
jgi:hypothetical protein